MAHDRSDGSVHDQSSASGLVPQKGMMLIRADGEEVGEIDLVEANYVIVRKGLFPQDHYIPVSDIVSRAGDTALRLATPAQEALERGLGNPMVGAGSGVDHTTTSGTARSTDGAVVEGGDLAHDDTVGAGVTEDIDVVAEAAPLPATTSEPEPIHAEAEVETGDETPSDDMHHTISLAEEEVTATTRPVERGVVRVQKQVTEERQTFEVPLVEDEVHVTRRRVDREITDEDAAFEERTIKVPLRGQGVEIEKRARVVEEVDIGKTAHQHIERVTETVRHEDARIEGADTGAPHDQPDDALPR